MKIRTRLVLYVILVSLPPLVAVAVIARTIAERALRQHIGEASLQIAELAAGRIDEHLYNHWEEPRFQKGRIRQAERDLLVWTGKSGYGDVADERLILWRLCRAPGLSAGIGLTLALQCGLVVDRFSGCRSFERKGDRR